MESGNQMTSNRSFFPFWHTLDPWRSTVFWWEKTARGLFFKENAAVVVTERADTQQVVVEVGHDVPGGCGGLGEEEIT